MIRAVLLLLMGFLLLLGGGPGFRTQRQLDQHFEKHGHEFGRITKADYLRFAQELRDARAGGPILEELRRDGVITRFDGRRGWFGAYERNGIIRTFFIPVQGERYFRRQAQR